jgi:hypothetical protein
MILTLSKNISEKECSFIEENWKLKVKKDKGTRNLTRKNVR